MDIKKKLKNVEKKILSFDEEFNEEEQFLIFHNDKLTNEYIIALSKDPNIWKKHDVLIDDYYDMSFLEDKELENVVENILFNYYKNTHTLSFSPIDDIIRTLECPNGIRNDLARKLTDLILSDKYKLRFECDTYAMAILIKNDRKDIIANIESLDVSITEKMLEKYYKYCLKNNITPIINMYNYKMDITLKYLEHFSLDDLIKFLFTIYDNEPEEIILRIYNTILQKISNEEAPIKLKTSLEGLSYKIPIDRVNRIFKGLYAKGDYNYASELVKNKIISREELSAKLKEYILSKKTFDDREIERNISYIDDKDIVIHLAKTNQIKLLFRERLKDTYFANKEQVINELINNKKIKELLKDISFNDMYRNGDLVLELAKRGLIETLTIDTRDDYISKNNIKLLETIIDEYHITLKPLVSTFAVKSNHLILEFLLKYNHIKEFIMATKYFEDEIDLVKKNIAKIIPCIDQDIIAFEHFTQKFFELVLENSDLQTFYAENDIYLTEVLLKHLRETIVVEENDYKVTPQFYKKFKNNIIKLYNIKEENLDILYKKFGPRIILYLDNENIRKLATFDKKDVQKIIGIFSNEELSIADLNAAYISIREYTFSKENPEQAGIYTLLMQAIKDDDQEKIKDLIETIDKYFDEKLFADLNSKYKLVESGFDLNNHYRLLLFITEKIKTSPNKEKYQVILHKICDYYVACKRTEFADVNKISLNLRLPFKYDEKDLEEKLTKYIVKYENNKDRLKLILSGLLDIGFSKEELLELIALLRGEKKAADVNQNIMSHIKFFKKSMVEYVKEIGYLPYYLNELDYRNMGVNKSLVTERFTTLDELKILSNIDMNNIKNIIDGDERVFETLKELFIKKKIHLLPKNIVNILQTDYINVSYTPENIAAIINYYPQIYQYEQKKVFNSKRKKLVDVTRRLNELIVRGHESKAAKLQKKKKQLEEELTGEVPVSLAIMQALLSSETYRSVSSVFALVLTPEDARLIKDNPGPNDADNKTKNNERLKEAIEFTKILFTRDGVTIPTFNTIVNVNDESKVRVIVGNFTDPCNLTHGERTGSCMRIGGVGESLFRSTLKNKNGFHIKFEDPKTGEYISRVSGFRNGNTVFLNELRETLNEELLTNEGLIDALKKISEMIIKESKKSPYPIENVVISKNVVLENYLNTVDLGIGENGESIGDIYNNINTSNCVVLATSSPDEFAPIKLNIENLPVYLPARRTPRETSDKKELSKYVNRIESVKRLLAGEDYKLFTNKFEEQDIIYGLVNDEWYIYIDSDYHIHSDCIETDERAIKEYQENLEKVDLYLQELCEQQIER